MLPAGLLPLHCLQRHHPHELRANHSTSWPSSTPLYVVKPYRHGVQQQSSLLLLLLLLLLPTAIATS
jgi:hypothetical protein